MTIFMVCGCFFVSGLFAHAAVTEAALRNRRDAIGSGISSAVLFFVGIVFVAFS